MYGLLLKNQIVNSIILVVLLLLLRIILFVDDFGIYEGPMGFLYSQWVTPIPLLGSWIITSLLLIIQLYILLLICLQLKMSSEATLIPGLAFVLFSTLIPDFGVFQPLIISNTFLLLALHNIFKISPRKASAKQIFNAGLFLSMATLFYSSYIFFLIAAVSGINIIRSYRFNDIKVLLLGFATPIFLFGVWYFWQDQFGAYSTVLNHIGFPSIGKSMDYYHLGTAIIVLVITLGMVFNNTKVMSKKTNIKQNYFKIVYWFLASCLVLTLFQKSLVVEHLAILAIPLSIITSEYLINWKKFNAQLVINVILVLIIVYQLKNFVIA